MKKYLIFILPVFLIIASCADKTITGNGNVISKTREIGGFKSISIRGAYTVVLKNTDKESVTIVADENLMNIIKTEINDSVLEVSNKLTILRSKELKIIIGCPKLSALDFSGAVDLSCDTGLHYKNLAITISGAGKINMGLEAEKLNTVVSGGAELIFCGKTNFLGVTIAGAGNIDATKLETKESKIEISGFGRAKLNVSEKLDVTISGYGNVTYSGNPAIKQSISGAGKVEKL